MNNFSFSIPSKITFGSSSINNIKNSLPENIKRVLIVSEDVLDNKISVKRIESILLEKNIKAIVYDDIGPGATSKKIEKIVKLSRSGKVEVIIGLGGIKVLSIAKTASLLVNSKNTIYDLIDNNDFTGQAVKFVSIPTSPGGPFLLNSKSLIIDARSNSPKVLNIKDSEAYSVIIDPELSSSLSKKYTIAILMRIILSSIEGLFSTKSSFLSDNYFYRGIKSALNSLSLIESGKIESEFLLIASQSGLLSAMGLTISEQGIGSAISYAINSEYSFPKSLLSSILLPYILESGIKTSPKKMFELGKVLGVKNDGSSPDIAAEDTVNHIRREIANFEIPLRLGNYNLKENDIPKISQKALNVEILKSLPQEYTIEDINNLIHKLL